MGRGSRSGLFCSRLSWYSPPGYPPSGPPAPRGRQVVLYGRWEEVLVLLVAEKLYEPAFTNHSTPRGRGRGRGGKEGEGEEEEREGEEGEEERER